MIESLRLSFSSYYTWCKTISFSMENLKQMFNDFIDIFIADINTSFTKKVDSLQHFKNDAISPLKHLISIQEVQLLCIYIGQQNEFCCSKEVENNLHPVLLQKVPDAILHLDQIFIRVMDIRYSVCRECSIVLQTTYFLIHYIIIMHYKGRL